MTRCRCGRALDTEMDVCSVCIGIQLGVFPESIRKMVRANEVKAEVD